MGGMFWRVVLLIAIVGAGLAYAGPTIVNNFRYSYVVSDGTVWRLDRFTNESCRVAGDAVDCSPISASKSNSRSVSTSTSTSTSVSVAAKKS